MLVYALYLRENKILIIIYRWKWCLQTISSLQRVLACGIKSWTYIYMSNIAIVFNIYKKQIWISKPNEEMYKSSYKRHQKIASHGLVMSSTLAGTNNVFLDFDVKTCWIKWWVNRTKQVLVLFASEKSCASITKTTKKKQSDKCIA